MCCVRFFTEGECLSRRIDSQALHADGPRSYSSRHHVQSGKGESARLSVSASVHQVASDTDLKQKKLVSKYSSALFNTCMSSVQVEESRRMLDAQRRWRSSREGQEWSAKRQQLPVVQIQAGLLAALADHDLVVVGGDTGCGKTTQACSLIGCSLIGCHESSESPPCISPAASLNTLLPFIIRSATRFLDTLSFLTCP